MRTYLIDNVRKHAPKIFAIDSRLEWYSANFNRSSMPELVKLLKNPKQPDETYPLHPRVLFTDYEAIEKDLFGSVAILNVGHSPTPLTVYRS